MVFSELQAELSIDISDYLSGLATASAATRSFGSMADGELADLDMGDRALADGGQVEFGLDTAAAQAKLDALEQELREVRRAAGRTARAINEVGDESTDTAGETSVLRGALGRLTAPFRRARSAANRAALAIDRFGDETSGTTGETRAATGVVGRFVRRLRATARSGRRAASAVDDVGDEIVGTASQVSLVSGAMRRLSRAFVSVIPGANRASSAIDEVGDEASGTAGETSFLTGVLGGLASGLWSSILPATLLADRLDEVGDEATGTAGELSILAGVVAGLSFVSAVSGLASLVRLLGKLGLILGGGVLASSIAGLVGPLAGVAGAAVGVAGSFGLILGTGFLAYMKKYPKELGRVTKEIKRMLTVFGEQFIPLIRDGVLALDDLVAAMLKATGNMKPFVRALRDLGQWAFRVLPKIVDFFFTLGREALPEMRAFARYLTNAAVPAVRTLGRAYARVEDELVALLKALADFTGELIHFGSVVLPGVLTVLTKFVRGLTDLMQILRTPPTQTRKALQRMGRALDALQRKLAPLSRGFGSVIDQLIRLGANIVTVATRFITKLIPATEDFTKTLTDGLKAINRFIEELFDLGKGTKDAASAFQELKTKVSRAMGGIASAITKKLPKIENLGETFKDLKKTGKKALKALDRAVSSTMRAVNRHLLKPLQNAESEWAKTWQSMQKEADQTLSMILDIVTGYLGRVSGEFREYAGNVSKIWARHFGGKTGIVASARDAMKALWKVIKPALDELQKAWDKWGDEILDIVEFTWDFLLTNAEISMDMFLTAVNVFLDLMSGDWEEAWGHIEDFTDRTLDRLDGFFDEWGSGLVDYLSGVWSDIVSDTSDAVDDMKKSIIDGFENARDRAVSAAKDLASDVVDALRDIISDAKQAGKDMIIAFAKGIASSWGVVKNAIEGILSKARKRLPGSDAEKGPLSDITAAGRALPETLAAGMLSRVGAVERASDRLAAAAAVGVTGYAGVGVSASGAGVDTPYQGDSGSGEQEVAVTIDVRGDSPLAKMIERHIDVNEQETVFTAKRGRTDRFSGA